MTREEALDRLLVEIRTKGIAATNDYVPSTDHYIPLRFLEYYLKLSYGMGFDEGRHLTIHRRKINQLQDGVVIHTFDSLQEAANKMKIDVRTIKKLMKGKVKKSRTLANEFTWQWVK
jgi:hypothetical protein